MRTSIKLFIGFFLALLLNQIVSTEAFAQLYASRINRYTVSTFTPSFSSITGTGSYIGVAGDDVVGTISLPFNFTYDSITYTSGTTIYITSNGSINFANNSINTTANRIASSTYALHLCPMTGDMYTNGMYSEVSGSSPNRVWTLEWTGFRYWTGGNSTTMQLKLYETTNRIEFLYQSSVTLNGYGGIGLNGSTSPSFMYTAYTTSSNVTPDIAIRYTVPPTLPDRQITSTPKSMNFGSLLTGQSSFGVVTVTHVGKEGVITLSPPTFSGPAAADYVVSAGPTPSGTLNIGQSATYNVRFTPSVGGVRNATMYINSDGRDSGTQTISLTGTGIAPQIQVTPAQIFRRSRVVVGDSAEESIIISSIGAAQLYFTNYPNAFLITGNDAPSYRVSRMPMNPLPPGGTDTLKIKFVPDGEGARWDARVTIYSNAENAPLGNTVTFRGTGIIPRMVIAPTYIDFDSTQVSDSMCKTFKIYNTGSDTLRLRDQYFASNDGDFSMFPITGQSTNIAANDSGQVTVCFKPLQKGTRQARVRVRGNQPLTKEQYPRDTSYVDVEIRGNAIPLDQSKIALGDMTNPIIGEESATTLELTNQGTDPVVVKAPVITGANASEFTVSKVIFPATVAPGTTISMTVTAKPVARGERSANIKFNLTSEGRPYSVNTDVKTTALLACATNNVTNVTFEKLLLDETASKTVEVSNCGDIPQVFTASLTGSNAYVLDAQTAEVPVGGKATFTVTFSPKAEGAANGTLTIKGSHISDMAVTLNGTGEKKPEVTQSVSKTTEADGFILEQNSPNPAVGYTSFTFTAPKQSNVRLYLADMSGKVVKEIANSAYSTGKHTVSMDTKDLASGSYIYILEAGATRIMRQMVVTK